MRKTVTTTHKAKKATDKSNAVSADGSDRGRLLEQVYNLFDSLTDDELKEVSAVINSLLLTEFD